MEKVNIFWFRRDLRTDDNAGFFHALATGLPVVPVFIFDRHILEKLDNKQDKRISFIHNTLDALRKTFGKCGSDLRVYHASPREAFSRILNEFRVASVFCNRDYEPYARERDQNIEEYLEAAGVRMQTYRDHVVFEKDEVLKPDGKPYTVFTPYMRQWKKLFMQNPPVTYDSASLLHRLAKLEQKPIPSPGEMGFAKVPVADIPSAEIREEVIRSYDRTRDFPALDGTSRLGIHLRFGTVSIRNVVEAARANEVFMNELIWREFYMMILWHFPHVAESAFRPAYDRIVWQNDENAIRAWMEGLTGYPMVDAGMRQLNATGYMHNRLRMITASFLVKHLLVDWRIGEKYFADRLLDFELASNNGGWQWAAGTGCDAAPWFRIFNPTIQQKKFDPEGAFVRRWVPEAGTPDYVMPIVEHGMARDRALKAYRTYLNN